MSESVRILLIDDQPDFLEPMSFWMKSKGFEVVTATDGEAGIELVREGSVDVVFVDYKMPGMNGLEAIRRIRDLNKTIPVVILTAHADDIDLQRGTKDLNIFGLFPKMAKFEDLDNILDVISRTVKKNKSETGS